MPAPRAWHRRLARGGRVGDAAACIGQHQRAHDHDRRKGIGYDPRQAGACGGLTAAPRLAPTSLAPRILQGAKCRMYVHSPQFDREYSSSPNTTCRSVALCRDRHEPRPVSSPRFHAAARAPQRSYRARDQARPKRIHLACSSRASPLSCSVLELRPEGESPLEQHAFCQEWGRRITAFGDGG